MRKYNDVFFRPFGMNMVEENKKIWMILTNRNCICEIDIVARKAKIRKVFEEKSSYTMSLYSCAEKIGNKLVLSPDQSDKIAIYDLECDSTTYIPLKKVKHEYNECQENPKFSTIFQYKSDVYLLGYSYPAIVKIDMISGEAEYITDWLEEIDANIKAGDYYGYFTHGYVLKDDLALIPVGCMGAVLELNLETAHTKLRKLKVSMKGISGLSSADGETIWMVGKGSRTNYLSCWNIRTEEIKEFWLSDVDENIYEPFYEPICTDSKVILMPMDATCIYEFHINTERLIRNKILESCAHLTNISIWAWLKTGAPTLQGGCLRFLTGDDWGWHEYNMETGECRDYFISSEENMQEIEQHFNEIYLEAFEKNIILFDDQVPLEYFIDRVLDEKGLDVGKNYNNRLIGNKIYNQLCGN